MTRLNELINELCPDIGGMKLIRLSQKSRWMHE